MKQFEQQNGYRLLDMVDVHGYITPSGLSGSVGDAAMETLRMTSTRALWDPNYYPPGGGFEDATGAEVAVSLGAAHAPVGGRQLPRNQDRHHGI